METRGVVLAGCGAAIVASVIATSGITSAGTSQVLLASAATIALSLNWLPRGRP